MHVSSWQVHGACRNTHHGRQQQQQQRQQRPKQAAAGQSGVITDAMTVRDLAHALGISAAALDGKLVDMGEIVESEEDMCATFITNLQLLLILCQHASLLGHRHTVVHNACDDACALQSFRRCSRAGGLGHGLRVHSADFAEWLRCAAEATSGHDRRPCRPWQNHSTGLSTQLPRGRGRSRWHHAACWRLLGHDA